MTPPYECLGYTSMDLKRCVTRVARGDFGQWTAEHRATVESIANELDFD